MKVIRRTEITTKSVNLRYLYDVAAIPKTTREEYLIKISKRLNSYKQKNVRLLKIIYKYIEEDRKIFWNDEVVCRKLSISKTMLYSYKSILLKGLREYFFNWKALEKEKFGNVDKNDIEILFEKAELMQNIGMRREAKHIFLKVEKLLSKKRDKLNKNVILFRTFKNLSQFYYVNQNFEKFNYYYIKTEKLGKTLIKKEPQLTSFVNLKLYTNKAAKIIFFGDKTSPVAEVIKLEEHALIEARNLMDHEEEAIVVDSLTKMYDLFDFKKGLKYARIGMAIGKKNRRNDIYVCFKAYFLRMKFRLGKINRKNVIEEIKKLLNQFNYMDFPGMKWKQWFWYNMKQLTSVAKGAEEIRHYCLYKYNENEIICKGLNLSLRSLYFMKWNKILSEITPVAIEYDELTSKNYIALKKMRNECIVKLDSSILELSCSKKYLREIGFRKEFLTIMLLADFCKGDKCSYEFSKHIMKQIEYLNKTRPEFKKDNQQLIEISYFGILLMSDSQFMDSELFLKKYELKFKQIADSMASNTKYMPTTEYYMLSLMAEQSGYSELKEIAKKTFWKIQKKYPKLMQEEIEKIKERDKADATAKLSQNIKAA